MKVFNPSNRNDTRTGVVRNVGAHFSLPSSAHRSPPNQLHPGCSFWDYTSRLPLWAPKSQDSEAVPEDGAHSACPRKLGTCPSGPVTSADFPPLLSVLPTVVAWVYHYFSCSWLGLLDGNQILFAQGLSQAQLGLPSFICPILLIINVQ